MKVAGAIPGYFDPEYYEKMRRVVRRWIDLEDIDDSLLAQDSDREECIRLLFLEARLIDRLKLEEWLELFTDDCAYWIPADVKGADPATNVSWEFNDRRRLEERIERLQTGKAYSQIPPTRTVHSYTNIEIIRTDKAGELHALCNFSIHTFARGEYSTRAGWNGFILRKTSDSWSVVMKRVNLFDADLPQFDNSFIL
jgi:3-phenylpropionate/cinnamic acid dioxygenase small subunit